MVCNERDAPPNGYTMIAYTIDSSESPQSLSLIMYPSITGIIRYHKCYHLVGY